MAKQLNLSLDSDTQILTVTKVDDEGCVVYENGQPVYVEIVLSRYAIGKLIKLGVPDTWMVKTEDDY